MQMNSFGARDTLTVAGQAYEYFRLGALPAERLSRLPFSLRILLENLLRHEDGRGVTAADVQAAQAAYKQAEQEQGKAVADARAKKDTEAKAAAEAKAKATQEAKAKVDQEAKAAAENEGQALLITKTNFQNKFSSQFFSHCFN